MVYALIGLGFAGFGLLVGSVIGLSSAELTGTLLGMLFALIGGSLTGFLGKLSAEGRLLAGLALLCFSLPATLAMYGGIYVRVNDVLSEQPRSPAARSAHPYLRGLSVEKEQHYRQQLLREEMSLAEVCLEIIESGHDDPHSE